MSEIKNVILIGASGQLGPSVLKAFQESSFNTTVLSREGSSSTFPSDVKLVRANLDSSESLTNALKGQDAVISIVGGMTLGDQQKLIDAAIAAGVKRFIPSEFGSNTADPHIGGLVPFFKMKRQTIEYLQSKEGVMSWSAVANGPFYDWGLKVGFLGYDAKSKTATLVDDGTSTISFSTLRQVGIALVKVLQQSEATKNQYIYISSFELSQKEILATIEGVTGEQWTVKNADSKELLAAGNEALKNKDFSGVVKLLQGAAFSGDGQHDFRKIGLWNEKLGLQKEDLMAATKAGISGYNFEGN